MFQFEWVAAHIVREALAVIVTLEMEDLALAESALLLSLVEAAGLSGAWASDVRACEARLAVDNQRLREAIARLDPCSPSTAALGIFVHFREDADLDAETWASCEKDADEAPSQEWFTFFKRWAVGEMWLESFR